MKYWNRIRTTLLALAVLGPIGFGVMQATASTPSTTNGSCNQYACRTECAPFGGHLGPGGPGKPLQCYCCG